MLNPPLGWTPSTISSNPNAKTLTGGKSLDELMTRKLPLVAREHVENLLNKFLTIDAEKKIVGFTALFEILLVLKRELIKEKSDEMKYSHFLCMSNWKTNYRYAIDNVMDPMHGSYLHATSHSMAEGDKQAEMRVRKTPTGLMFEKVGQRDVNFDWVELGDTGCLWLRLAIPYKKRYGPGGNFGIVGFATPVDDKHCQVYFWRTRKVQGLQRNVWRFMYRNRLEALHWAVLEQDQFVLESLPDDARSREFLYEHDVGLARVRRLLEKRATEQATQRVAARAPATT